MNSPTPTPADSGLQQLRIERSLTPRTRRPRWRKPLFIVLVLAVLVAAGMMLRAGQAVEVTTVRVTQAWPSAALTELNATGFVVAQKKASVATKATGRLEAINVREGSVVKEGDLLAQLENADLKAQLAQAEANVESARARLEQAEADATESQRSFDRSRDLLARGFISPASHDTALSRRNQSRAVVNAQKAAVRQAEAAVKAAQVELDNTVIRAPFAGVVLTKNADVGDVVAPFNTGNESKGAVVTMADLDTLEVEADVSESSLFKVKIGQPCEIQLDALPDVRLLGKVERVVPTVDRSKATVTVKVSFQEKDVRVLPEMSAKVAFLRRTLTAGERVPRTAVNPAAVKEEAIFAVRDGVAHRQQVVTGRKLGDPVELKQGAQAGDVVVLDPPANLKDGAKVAEKKP